MDEPFARRGAVLEALFTDHRLAAPWTLCPSTTDPAIAGEWLYDWTDVPGVEGVEVKSLTGRNRPGARGWPKARCRVSTEALIGGVTGFPVLDSCNPRSRSSSRRSLPFRWHPQSRPALPGPGYPGYSCQSAVAAARPCHSLTPGPFGSHRSQNCRSSSHRVSMAALRTGQGGTSPP